MGRHNSTNATRSTRTGGVCLRALLSLGMVAGLGAVGTLAAWTDEATATATFSAGKLDLTLNGDPDDAVDLTSLSMTNMYPAVQKAAIVGVSNTGTLPFTYNITAGGATSALLSALTVAVYETDATGQLSTNGTTCVGKLLAASSTTFDAAELLSVDRPLGPTSSEQLCIQVTLPGNAANELQGTTAEALFTFVADQAP